MDELQLRRERRRQRALERLGSNHPRCVLCGYDDPLALELHHVAGKDYDGALMPVCRNCHRRLSDAQKDHALAGGQPPSDGGQLPSDPERIGHFLLGLADLFELLVKWLREHATKLFAIGATPQAPTSGERP